MFENGIELRVFVPSSYRVRIIFLQEFLNFQVQQTQNLIRANEQIDTFIVFHGI